jgi:hypothetical protein
MEDDSARTQSEYLLICFNIDQKLFEQKVHNGIMFEIAGKNTPPDLPVVPPGYYWYEIHECFLISDVHIFRLWNNSLGYLPSGSFRC